MHKVVSRRTLSMFLFVVMCLTLLMPSPSVVRAGELSANETIEQNDAFTTGDALEFANETSEPSGSQEANASSSASSSKDSIDEGSLGLPSEVSAANDTSVLEVNETSSVEDVANATTTDVDVDVQGQTTTKMANGSTTTVGPLTVTLQNAPTGVFATPYYDWVWTGATMSLANAAKPGKFLVTSSNTAVAKAEDGYEEQVVSYVSDFDLYAYVKAGAQPGAATITIAYAEDEGDTYAVSFGFVTYPTGLVVSSIKKAGYGNVTVSWKSTPQASGFYVKRQLAAEYYKNYEENLQTVATAKAGAASVTVAAPWNKEYFYHVVPFVTYNGKNYSDDTWPYGDRKTFTLEAPTVSIMSAGKSGASAIKVVWNAEAGASKFELMRSTHQNYGYQTVATLTSTSCTNKVSKGTTYYYKVVATYPGQGKVTSKSVSKMIPKSAKAKKVRAKALGKRTSAGTYSGNWAYPDSLYSYQKGSITYVVNYMGGKLRILGYNASMKVVSKKTVKLPKHDIWGGFYHGPDGNNYVALGYNNPKQSRTKTVIKVIKYSAKWKKGKTATIKGSASNSFEGIYAPFHAGSSSFDMRDTTLYLHTCRTMFTSSDGYNHQSNIAFAIDTKSMKAKEANVSYVSHSFNQRVRLRDGNIFLADHGDAYPRSITLCVGMGFDPTGASQYGYCQDSNRYDVVPFLGGTGDNYTGATLGGMEVGRNNVLMCGTSQPHKSKVGGVKGFSWRYGQNVFVSVTNVTTGKSKMVWLTTYSPKKGNVRVSEARMVKIDDDHYGVLYSTLKGNKATLHYVVVNENGKRLRSKTYKNYAFWGSMQPALSGGSIWWAESPAGGVANVYRIPAL